MIIIHRCPDCGMSDLQHTSFQRAHCRDVCRRERDDLIASTEPEIIPTWTVEAKVLVETVTEPGTRFAGLSNDTCDCAKCRSLYARQAA